MTLEPAEHATPFIGREKELREIIGAFDATVAGIGGLVMVSGEPGIGKSALCEQLAVIAQLKGGLVLRGHCYEEGSLSLPYLPFVEALGHYVTGRDARTLKSELGVVTADVARIVPELRERLQVESRPAGESSDDRWRLLQGVLTLLRSISATQPLMLMIEDLHWADSDTLDLLLHVARNSQDARLLLIGTYRDIEVDRAHPLSAVLAELRRTGSFQRIALRGLTLDEVHVLYETLWGSEVALSQAALIHDQTEGNPLFVQEVLRYLLEADLVGHDGEKRPRQGMTIPAGLRDVLGMHLNRLSAECNQMLALAAVIGREFDVETLRRVTGLEEGTLASVIEEAERSAVVEERTRPGLLHYRFTHALFRQTLYEEISAPRRLRHHQLIGRSLEDQFGTRAGGHAQELAEHFSNSTDAADLAKAIYYGRLAAEAAMLVFAYGEATRLLDRAIDIQNLVDPEDKESCCDLLLRLGEALVAGGERKRILEEVAPAALALAQALDDKKRAFTACRIAIDSAPGALPYWLDTAEGCVGDDPVARIRLNHSLSVRLFHEGRINENLAILQETMALARKLAEPNLMFASAHVLLRSSDLSSEEERPIFEELLASRRPETSVRDLSDVQLSAVAIHLQWGERSKAEVSRRELAELAVQTQHHQALLNSAAAGAVFDILEGRLPEAMKPRLTQGSFPRIWQGRVAAWLGDSGALETAVAANEVFVSQSILGPAFKAFFLSYLGRFEQAREVLAGMLPGLAAGAPAQVTSHWLKTLLLEVAALSGDSTTARVLLDLNKGDERHLAKPFLVLLPRHAGSVAMLLGRYDEARAFYAEAINFCEKIRYRPELALTHLDLADLLLKHYPAQHAEAGQHISFAIPEFEAMGMVPSLEKALTLQAGASTLVKALPTDLSERQAQVLDLIAVGKTTREIAAELVLSERTIERHIADVYAKIGTRNRAEATVFALSRRLEN